MKVKEIVALLNRLPDDVDVLLEGCDCVGNSFGIVIRDTGEALICRDDGRYQIELMEKKIHYEK